MKLSVIIPAYNEEQTIGLLLDKVIASVLPDGVSKEIIIVDDGSIDRTMDVVQTYINKASIRFFRQENRGKTAAVLRGIHESTGDVVLIQDADLEYDPAEYAKLLDPIVNGKSVVVYGSRFLGTIKNMRFPMRLANIMTNITLNMIYGTKLTDNNTCYKVFKKDVLDDITITSSHFGFDCELTVKLLKKRISILEIPIQYVARSRKEGKKITFFTSFGSYLQIFRYAVKD